MIIVMLIKQSIYIFSLISWGVPRTFGRRCKNEKQILSTKNNFSVGCSMGYISLSFFCNCALIMLFSMIRIILKIEVKYFRHWPFQSHEFSSLNFCENSSKLTILCKFRLKVVLFDVIYPKFSCWKIVVLQIWYYRNLLSVGQFCPFVTHRKPI